MSHRRWCVLVVTAFLSGVLSGRVVTTAQAPELSPSPQERVTGIGGIFFKAKDPLALAEWYRTHLGIDVRATRATFEWREPTEPTSGGLTVWAVFPDTTTYFSPGSAEFMVNYRVTNLDRMVAQLRARDVAVEPRISEEAAGRFAWVVDPEGNRIELWEPRR